MLFLSTLLADIEEPFKDGLCAYPKKVWPFIYRLQRKPYTDAESWSCVAKTVLAAGPQIKEHPTRGSFLCIKKPG
jgi:hypothetical protein